VLKVLFPTPYPCNTPAVPNLKLSSHAFLPLYFLCKVKPYYNPSIKYNSNHTSFLFAESSYKSLADFNHRYSQRLYPKRLQQYLRIYLPTCKRFPAFYLVYCDLRRCEHTGIHFKEIEASILEGSVERLAIIR